MMTLPTILRTATMRRAIRARVRGLACGVWLAALAGSAAALPSGPGSTSLPVIVADFNHDGLPDALVPASSGASATLALGTVPYGSFSSSAKVVTFPSACTGFVADPGNAGSLVAGDFNGDGFADLLFTCNTSSSATLTGVMLGIGDGTFAPAVTLTTAYATGTVLGDFNHDGKLDAVAVVYPNGIYFGTNNQTAALYFFSGNGDGTFAAAVSSALGTSTTFEPGNFILGSPVAADVNGDGYPDIVLNAAYGYSPANTTGATLTVSVFGNRRDGTFGAVAQAARLPDATVAVGTYPASNDLKVIAGSFTGPGKTDFVVPDTGTPGYFLVANTSTTTTYSLAPAVKTPYAGLAALAGGSFTGSGVTDLVAADGTNLVVLANDGTGHFAANYSALSLPATSSLFSLADANLDGYTDVYTAALGTSLGVSVNLVSGSATATSQPFSLAVGSRATSASWLGNVLFTGATVNGTQTVNGAPTLTVLASSKNPSTVGDSVTFSVVVAATGTATVAPTGMVTFSDGMTSLGSMPLDGTGRTALTTSALSVATHAIVASYGGDGFYAMSTSAPLAQVVNPPLQVAPTLTWPAPAPITYGTALSGAQLNAVATNAAGAAVQGVFVYSPAAGTVLRAGVQTLRVTFTPTDLTTYSVATATVPLTVLAAVATTALVVSSGGALVTSVSAGSVVTLTASVKAGAMAVPVGQVKFCDAAAASCSDSHLVGTAQLTVAGTAVVRFVPAIGIHSYKAVFVGTGNDVGSASAASALVVTGTFATTTTIAQSGTVGNYALTATVVGAGGATSPTGTVAFLDTSNSNAPVGSALLGSGSVALGLKTAGTPSSGIEPEATATADFNNDGIADIVTLNPSQFHGVSGTGTLTVLLGKGDGTFTAGTSPSVPGADSALAVGDFNGDGNADIAVLNDSGVVTILLGNGAGTFTAAPAGPTLTGSPGSLVVGDFDGDGNADLAVSNYAGTTSNAVTTILLGKGDGTFSVGPATTNTTTSFVQAAGDFNQDGKLDLLTVNGTGSTAVVLLGNGDGTFTVSANLPASIGNFGGGSIADFNGDGKPDFAVGGLDSTGHLQLTVYLGNGDGTFATGPTTNTTDTTYSYSFHAGDFNGDGKPDLVVADDAFTRILVGNGDGTFSSAATAAVPNTGGPDYLTSAVADFNGDGVPDSASANTDLNTVTVLLTQPTATVTALANGVSPIGSGPHQVVASYPGDGVFASSASAATSLTGQTITPVLTWVPAVSTVSYGIALSAQQLNASAASATGAPVAGTFVYTPAAGTVLGAGTQTLRVVFTPTSNVYVPVSGSVTITVTQAQPKIAWTSPAAIAYGTALSGMQLNASVTGVGAGALAGVLTYTPAAGTVLTPGTQTLSVSFAPLDALDYASATASVPLTVTGLVLTSITPTIVPLGSPATTFTLTGSGFVAGSVVQVNGTAVATTYVNPTTLTALVPATYLAQAGTLAVRVLDPAISALSAALNVMVIPTNPSITLSGPPVTSPGSQPTVTLTIVNPYPLPLTASFSLSFVSSGASPVDDPAIQFAAGGRTLTIVVPANSTVVPPIQLQAGTDAGTITIPLVLTTGGINVTPTGLAPVVIVVPATSPTISTATVTRGAGTFSVAIHGFSNTREVTMATFHFVAAPGATISTPDITAPVGTVFGGWFGSPASVAFGSTFTYTQVFNVSDDPKNIGSVQVTLTNGVGTSALSVAQ